MDHRRREWTDTTPSPPSPGFVGNSAFYSTFDWAPGDRVALFLEPLRRVPGIFSGKPGAPLTNYRRITSERARPALDSWVSAVDWSPDGTSLLFERNVACHDSDDPACPFEIGVELRDIYRVFTQGRPRERRLTRGGSSGSPAFSPDGTSMAFEDDDRGGIVIRRLSGGKTRLVGRGGRSAAWQPITGATVFR